MNNEYKENSSITVSGNNLRVAIKVMEPKTAILRTPNTDSEELLTSREWAVYDIESTVSDSSYYDRMLAYLGLSTN